MFKGFRNQIGKIKKGGKEFISEAKLAGKSTGYADNTYKRMMIIRKAMVGVLKTILRLKVTKITLANGNVLNLKKELKTYKSLKVDFVLAVKTYQDIMGMEDKAFEIYETYIELLEFLSKSGEKEFVFKFQGKRVTNIKREIKLMKEMVNERIKV